MNQVEQEHDDDESYEEQFQSLNLDSVSIVQSSTERGRPTYEETIHTFAAKATLQATECQKRNSKNSSID